MLGIGGGWNLEEMENHGTRPETRFKLMRERVEAMKAIWTQDEAEYHGDLVDFDPIWARPKPVQRPHPPIHVGGGAPHGARRAARYGDGWIPLAREGLDVVEQMRVLAEEAGKVGRDPSDIEVTLWGGPDNVDELSTLRDCGLTRAIFVLPSDGSDVVLPMLDRIADLADRIR